MFEPKCHVCMFMCSEISHPTNVLFIFFSVPPLGHSKLTAQKVADQRSLLDYWIIMPVQQISVAPSIQGIKNPTKHIALLQKTSKAYNKVIQAFNRL